MQTFIQTYSSFSTRGATMNARDLDTVLQQLGKNTVSVRWQNVTKFTEINVKVMAVLITVYYIPRKIIYHTIFRSVYG